VGLRSWFKPACTEPTSQFSSSPRVLNVDRRRAGRWDREQLIGGKPIEARKQSAAHPARCHIRINHSPNIHRTRVTVWYLFHSSPDELILLTPYHRQAISSLPTTWSGQQSTTTSSVSDRKPNAPDVADTSHRTKVGGQARSFASIAASRCNGPTANRSRYPTMDQSDPTLAWNSWTVECRTYTGDSTKTIATLTRSL
jgi:hypothetical protein